MEYIGLTISQAKDKLKANGITNVIIKENFKNPMPNSTLLVVSCKINDKIATLIVGSFKLDL